jgi:hypothetical protein
LGSVPQTCRDGLFHGKEGQYLLGFEGEHLQHHLHRRSWAETLMKPNFSSQISNQEVIIKSHDLNCNSQSPTIIPGSWERQLKGDSRALISEKSIVSLLINVLVVADRGAARNHLPSQQQQ